MCLLANSDCNLSYIVVETLLVSSLRVVEVFVPLLAKLRGPLGLKDSLFYQYVIFHRPLSLALSMKEL